MQKIVNGAAVEMTADEIAAFEADQAALAAITTAQVSAYRDQRLAAGFADAVTGKTWQCDNISISRWNAVGSSAGLAIVMATDPAPTFDLIAADNSQVTLSAADAFALFAGRVMPWVSATVLYARDMKDAILADNPPEDMTAGWP